MTIHRPATVLIEAQIITGFALEAFSSKEVSVEETIDPASDAYYNEGNYQSIDEK